MNSYILLIFNLKVHNSQRSMEIAKVKAKSFLRLQTGDFEIPELVVAKIFFLFS